MYEVTFQHDSPSPGGINKHGFSQIFDICHLIRIQFDFSNTNNMAIRFDFIRFDFYSIRFSFDSIFIRFDFI